MKYKKANEVLPERLLEEIQKYASGEMLYIPCPKGMRKEWGENSGSKAYLRRRNMEIKEQFRSGLPIDQLMEIFCLSYDSIKKIVYTK